MQLHTPTLHSPVNAYQNSKNKPTSVCLYTLLPYNRNTLPGFPANTFCFNVHIPYGYKPVHKFIPVAHRSGVICTMERTTSAKGAVATEPG